MKTNNRGFSHIILPLMIVIGVAVVGTYMIVSGYAATKSTSKLKPVKILSVKSTLLSTPKVMGYSTPGPCFGGACGPTQYSWCVDTITVHCVVKTSGAKNRKPAYKVYQSQRDEPLKKTGANRFEADWETGTCVEQSKGTRIALVGGHDTDVLFLAIPKDARPPQDGGHGFDDYTPFPGGTKAHASKIYVNVPSGTSTVESPPLQ